MMNASCSTQPQSLRLLHVTRPLTRVTLGVYANEVAMQMLNLFTQAGRNRARQRDLLCTEVFDSLDNIMNLVGAVGLE